MPDDVSPARAVVPHWDEVPVVLVVVDAGGRVAWKNATADRVLARDEPPPAAAGDRTAHDGRTWSWRIAPHSLPDHRLCIAYDVTERHDREAIANRRARRLAELLASTRDALVTIDRRGVIEDVNPAAERMFGWPADELSGQKVNVLMPEPYATDHDAYIERYERTGQGAAIGRTRTVAARRRSGEVFPIELTVTEVVVDEEVRYTAFVRDITHNVRLQEMAIDRERLAAIGTTSAAFAHEIGNPLNGMAMSAALLQKRLAKTGRLDAGSADTLAALVGEIERLSRLLDEFRAVARRPRLSVVPTDLASLLAAVLAGVQPRLDARNITARCELSPGLRASLVDPERIRQVLLNLINNAIDAMSVGGTLTLRTRAVEDALRIEVVDTGHGVLAGIDPFEPFVTTKPEGTGLGLSVARQIAGAHGGALHHEPAEEGGTVFVLTLPHRGL